MRDYSNNEIETAITELEHRLNRRAPEGLQEAFSMGCHPDLLSYDKIREVAPHLTALERYLVGARSALSQPAHFYDIFGACRHVKVVQLLNHALRLLSSGNVVGLEARTERLLAAKTYDEFDAILFELLVAARYFERPEVSGVEFIPETPSSRTADFKMMQHGRESFCECKKMDRSQDHALNLSSSADACLTPVIEFLRSNGITALAEVTFSDAPSTINSTTVMRACIAALRSGTIIIERGFSISAKLLPAYKSPTYKLYPSPDFFWSRYQYRLRGDWMGIVHQVDGSRTMQFVGKQTTEHGTGSWLDEIDWDSAVKWRVGAGELLEKSRRFGFNRIFDGLNQIDGRGCNSTVHLWIESDYYLGGREATLENLRERISSNATDNFGWIVINETLLDVSPKGIFDMIEHAHFMRGPTASIISPLVTNVFTDGSHKTGSFGAGVQLPDIDET